MLKGILGKVVGGSNDREIRKLQPLVDAINALEPKMEERTDAQLRAMTDQFRRRLAAGEPVDDLLVEAFAVVREVAKRTVDMRPFDVQLIGGIVLHRGAVAEMKTGEGKTLVATMPIYLNALLNRGAHLVTVNDYLARRDTLWMGAVYHQLGLSIGLLQSGAEQPAYLYDPAYQRDPYPGLRPVPRKEAYGAHITYGTNNEFGFDYLRDNVALSLERRVQRPLSYAIVDEVDNIFIDEARTPLIISGPSGESVEDYSRFASIARKLQPEVHYELDDKERSVYLTDEGLAIVEEETGIENIYDEANYRYVHYMQQALKAQVLFLEGRDYIRQRKQIILVDQHTGRLMPSRRLSEGLHQAIEAKEGVPIRPRDVTSATITIQNYFRMYEKLAGMSGTAVTEGEEFFKIYNLEVIAIPTNKPVIRGDHADVVYRSEEAKLRAVAREILTCHSQGQPVLVGTTSVENSERLSTRLTDERLQMAAIAPRVAYALQDANLEREERDSLRETMNASLETMNSGTWRRMVRALDLEPNALSPDNLAWLSDYLELRDQASARAMESALREGIPHEVLNAKEHTREAAIIARAGEPGAVTIATNMAGRGVDIKLGGELQDEVIHRAHQALEARGLDPFRATPGQMDSAIAEVNPRYAQNRDRVLEAGGLHVLGTERHEARRIDNQLRGRSGRQGEPGSSRFFLSLEDDLMRRFGRREMLGKLMETIGDDFPIEHGLVSRTLERAQTSVEGYNFDIRKHLLEYDDVLNRQRETIYSERLRILRSSDLRAEVWRMLETQVDEYLDKHGDGDERRLLFAGLDDVVPLTVPGRSAPFQGPVAFAGGLTAFPGFTVGFLADQYAGRPQDEVEQALQDIAQQAASIYGDQIRETVGETSKGILEKYDERLDKYRALLDEKIEDYLQLVQERGQYADPRRLAQHLERTFPLKLTMPQDTRDMDLDDLRDHWLAEVEMEYHRQACEGLVARVQIRLPSEVRIDRLRPARLPRETLESEMRRVLQLAAKQPRSEEGRSRLEKATLPAEPDIGQLLALITTIKEQSRLDFGRLDRLVNHVLGAYLEQLLEQYLEVTDEEDVRLRRDLERLRDSVVEGKKGGRASDLIGILQELITLVHVEVPVLEDVLSQAVAHEYDKWAEHQLSDIGTDAGRNRLADTSWSSIAEHILATHYTQIQVYDREHRRQASWVPRLPFNLMAQAATEEMDRSMLREALLASLRGAIEQREQLWGQQELRRWGHLSLDDLDTQTYDGLLRFLGEKELGHFKDEAIDDLPPDLYDRLRFVLAVRQWEERGAVLGELPQGDAVVSELAATLGQELLVTPIRDLDDELQEQIGEQMRQGGLLDDPQARNALLEQPIRDWERRTRDEVARFWGRQFIEAHRSQPFADLQPPHRAPAIAFLEDNQRFVDEARMQRFLIRERFVELPPETQQAALLELARARLERMSKRKLSNLDVSTRQVVEVSLQRMGLFTDPERRKELLDRTLSDLEPEVRSGFGAFVAREELADRPLSNLAPAVQASAVGTLRTMDALADTAKTEGLGDLRLGDLGSELASSVRETLVDQLRADLATKSMEELPADTRHRIHQVLDERNYFVDQERASWYERKTIAQLQSDILRDLEQRLGEIRFAELADLSFSEIEAETRQSVVEFLDQSRLFSDRAQRLRLIQSGTLGELPEPVRESVAHHLGRQWLVQLRDRRPPDLPARDREIVWVFLRERGYFADQFKEELFAYQRLDEFDGETRDRVTTALIGELTAELDSQPVGDLSPELQSKIREQLRQRDYFLNEERLRQAEQAAPADIPPDLRLAVETALGAHLLGELTEMPVAELPEEMRAGLWRYLDQVGYFVDEKRRKEVLDRRLVDLDSEAYEAAIADLANSVGETIGDSLVSDLDDDFRQGLREALEALEYFTSAEVREKVLAQPIGTLRREDLDALAQALGQSWLDGWGDRRLTYLPEAERDAILAHLQARDWFLDPQRMEKLQASPLGALEPDLRQELLALLQRQQVERLGRQRLASMDRGMRRTVNEVLRGRGLALEESQMRVYRRQRLSDLETETYEDLLKSVGEETVSAWDSTRFQNLDQEQQALLSAYLGRMILGRAERRVLLHTISRLWIDYLTDIEDLRRGIGLEAYGQRDPLVEYKRRAFELFEELGDNIRRTSIRILFRQPPEVLSPA
jgi:preprotein translocase subunit SecA